MQRSAIVMILGVFSGVGCSTYATPTAPTNAQMSLAISQASLPVGGTAVVTATLRNMDGSSMDRAMVQFTSSLGTFEPAQAPTVDGVATSLFTAKTNGTGMIGALSGPVVSTPIPVQVGALPTLPEINTTPAPPSVWLTCDMPGIAGSASAICSISATPGVTVAINWGDGSGDQSVAATGSAAHVYARGGQYQVTLRGVDSLGRVATANSIATVNNPQAPLPPMPAPTSSTSAFVSQEADIAGGCAVFSATATAGTGATITSFFIEKNGVKERDLIAPAERVAICGLVIGNVVTAKVTDSRGGQASYPVIAQ